jgi:hypothetical protein
MQDVLRKNTTIFYRCDEGRGRTEEISGKETERGSIRKDHKTGAYCHFKHNRSLWSQCPLSKCNTVISVRVVSEVNSYC